MIPRKKLAFLSICLTVSLSGFAQVLFTPQLPVAGINLKSQLWNATISNTSMQVITAKIIVKLSEVNSNTPVLSGTSNQFILGAGSKRILPSDVSPVLYILLNPSYSIDTREDGLLPVGVFNVCYQVFGIGVEGPELLTEECETIEVEPLSPPQLTFPSDGSVIDERRPLFSWIPPSPLNLLSNLTYDLKLVEVMAGQNSADALQQNFPTLQQTTIPNSFYQYPATVAGLDTGKIYAWQVTAKNNGISAGVTETWTFKIADSLTTDVNTKAETPFFKLIRNESTAYYRCVNELKFDYDNDLNDATATIVVFDLSNSRKEKIELLNEVLPLINGQNLIKIDLTQNNRMKTGHIYLLELKNSRGELWTGKFLYTKK